MNFVEEVSVQMTEEETLLLQGRDCNSVGRPCGKCRRASVKAEHIHLSLRLCVWLGGGVGGQSPFGKAPCHFPSWPPHPTSPYLSFIWGLFSVGSSWPDHTHIPTAHFLSTLFSLPLVLISPASFISQNFCYQTSPTFQQLLPFFPSCSQLVFI